MLLLGYLPANSPFSSTSVLFLLPEKVKEVQITTSTCITDETVLNEDNGFFLNVHDD